MNLRHGIPEKRTFCFHLFLFEYVVSLVSLEKTFIIIVLFLILIFVDKFCLYTEESTVYK